MRSVRKRKSITWWKKALWREFSKYIRHRDKGVCISCQRDGFEGSGYHGGHFITGSLCAPTLYFDERNVNGQCYNCNINKSGNWPAYEEAMIRKYSQEVVDELKQMRTSLVGEKWDIETYQQLRDKYRLLNKENGL